MAQNTVSFTRPSAVDGLIQQSSAKLVKSMRNAEATAHIAPGRVVTHGAGDNEALNVDASTDALVGIALQSNAFAYPDQVDDDGYLPGEVFDVLEVGKVSVVAEDVINLQTSGVHVRMEDGRGSAALVVADFVFTAEADDDTATAAAHGLLTGDGPVRVSNAGGALPGGLAGATDYWVIRVDDNSFKFATTLANALAGTAIAISSDGTGTQTLADTGSTARVVDGKAGSLRGTPGGEPLTFTSGAFTAANASETFTKTAHGLLTGDGPVQVSNSGGALPTGLSAATNYWVIRLTANTFRLATSRANALAGTNLSITDDGSGTQTIAAVTATERVTTMDISKFAKWRSSTDLPGQLAEVDVDFRKAALATLG